MKKKRLLSLLIVCSLIITLAVPLTSYGANFNDTRGHWAESWIDQAAAYGFVQGYPDGTFMPDKSVTRAEFITMINKALKNNATANITFSDVPYNEWYYQDVTKAFAATYVGGYDDNTFKPNLPIKREEAAVMISRLIPTYGSSGNLNAFPDRGSIDDWAYTAFQKVNGKGYMGAYDDGNLHPQDSLTRAQTAKIICDILDKEKVVTTDPVVKTNKTTLSNTIYSNGVTINRDLDDGSATIDNCVILGNLAVQGGGDNTVTINNSRVAQSSVEKSSSSVRVVVSGESVVSTMTAAREAIIRTQNLTGGLYGSGINNLNTLSGSDITLTGNFPKVTVNGSAAKLKLTSGTITNLIVGNNASKSEITVESGATVGTADVNAESYFHGAGTITKMNVNANGITYETKPGTVNVESRYDDPKKVDPEGDVTFNPANGATKVKLDTKITISFKTSMTLYNGKEITDSNIESIVDLKKKSASGDDIYYSAAINKAKTVITITPDDPLEDDTKYFVIIEKNKLKDEDGIGNAKQSISFSTGGGDSDYVTFWPKDGATGVSLSAEPTITFSEAIETYEGKAINNSYFDDTVIIFREGSSSSGTKVNFSTSYNSSRRELTITPTDSKGRDIDLKDGQKYYLGIANNKIRTVKGSTKISDNVTWTVGGVSPELSKISSTAAETSISVTAEANLKGTIYGVLLVKGSSKPSATQISNGQDSSGKSTAFKTSKSVDAKKSETLTFTGLTNNTTYTYYLVLKAGSSFSSIESKDVTTSTPGVNKSALSAAIGTATTAKSGVVTSTAPGSDVDSSVYWVTSAQMTTFESAIATATAVNANTSATQSQVDSAVSTLNAATSTFNGQKAHGTKVTVIKTALVSAITGANTAKSGVVTSEDGEGLTTGTKWVTSADMAALNEAILAASSVNSDSSATQAQVDSAASTLNSATSTFESVKQTAI